MRTATSLPLAPLAEDKIKELTKPREQHELPAYAICRKPKQNDARSPNDDDTKPLPVIGEIVFHKHGFDFKNRGCELGIGFHSVADRGKGYGREVLSWAIEYGFYELGLHRLGLVCYSLNPAGIALYRKKLVILSP